MKIVVIGGVAAGMSAAAKARRVNPGAEILVFEKGAEISYGACGLPYYVSGLNSDPNKLLIRDVEAFREQGIAVRTGCEVTSVDPAAKRVAVTELATGSTYTEGYDRLLIASGAAAVRPPLPGMALPGVYTLKSFQEGLALRHGVENARSVAVVGGGYIGVEVAESLHAAGKTVRVVEAAPHILAPFDPEIRDIIAARMKERGIALHLSEPVEAILEKEGRAAGVRTAAGEYPADIVVVALGVKPATGFLAGSGIRMAENGAIEVDRRQRASLPDVWAAGDCAMCYNRVENRNIYLALGTTANKCGRLAGANMAHEAPGGGAEEFEGCLSSAAIAVCGLEAGRTGMGEATARQLLGDEKVQTVFITANDRPQYYPGQTELSIKLVCERGTKRLLGAQAVGEKGAVLRVDAAAAAITGGLTARDLGWLDFCYAPPFSEAWDALNIAGNAVKP